LHCPSEILLFTPSNSITKHTKELALASNVNKDLGLKAKAKDLDPMDKAKDLGPKAKPKAKAKDLGPNAKAKDSRCQGQIFHRSFYIVF